MSQYFALIIDGKAITLPSGEYNRGKLLIEEFRYDDPKQYWTYDSTTKFMSNKYAPKIIFDIHQRNVVEGNRLNGWTEETPPNPTAHQKVVFNADGRIVADADNTLFITRNEIEEGVILKKRDASKTNQDINKIPEGYYIKNLFNNSSVYSVVLQIANPTAKNVTIPANSQGNVVWSPAGTIYSFAPSKDDFVFNNSLKSVANTGVSGATFNISEVPGITAKLELHKAEQEATGSVLLNWKLSDNSELVSYNVEQEKPSQVQLAKGLAGKTYTVHGLETNEEYRFFVVGTDKFGQTLSSNVAVVYLKGNLELASPSADETRIDLTWANTGAKFNFVSFTIKQNGFVIADKLSANSNSYSVTNNLNFDMNYDFVVEGFTNSGKVVVSNAIKASLRYSFNPTAPKEGEGVKPN